MPRLSGAADRLQRGLAGEPVPDAEVAELVRLAERVRAAGALLPAPSPDFVTRLRAELREAAGQAPGAAPTRVLRPRRSPVVLRLSGRAVRTAVAVLAVVAVVLAGIGVASRSALPGDVLYPVKQLLDRVAVDLSGSPYDAGRTYLDQAQGHIGEARRLAAKGEPSAAHIVAALDASTAAVRSADRELRADWARTHGERAGLTLRGFAARLLPELASLRQVLPPAALPALRRLVAVLTPFAAGLGLPGGPVAPSRPTGSGSELPGRSSPPRSGVAPTRGATGPGGVGGTRPGGRSAGGSSVPVPPRPTKTRPNLPLPPVTSILPTLPPVTSILPTLPPVTSILPTLPLP